MIFLFVIPCPCPSHRTHIDPNHPRLWESWTYLVGLDLPALWLPFPWTCFQVAGAGGLQRHNAQALWGRARGCQAVMPHCQLGMEPSGQMMAQV